MVPPCYGRQAKGVGCSALWDRVDLWSVARTSAFVGQMGDLEMMG